jgi:hypothetical protein
MPALMHGTRQVGEHAIVHVYVMQWLSRCNEVCLLAFVKRSMVALFLGIKTTHPVLFLQPLWHCDGPPLPHQVQGWPFHLEGESYLWQRCVASICDLVTCCIDCIKQVLALSAQ